MPGHGEKRSRKQDTAIVALVSEPSIGSAARAAGLSEATLWRWLQDPDFQRAYRAVRRQAVERAIADIQAACTEAVATLRAVMTDPDAPAASRVTAARTVLDTALRGVELLDLEERIAGLEEAAMLDAAIGNDAA